MGKQYERLTLKERISISQMLIHQTSYEAIAIRLGRNKSSIQREVVPWGKDNYDPLRGQEYAIKGASMRKKGKLKLKGCARLANYVLKKLQLRWSPEQIAQRVQEDFPSDKQMRISHETIYLYVYLHTKKTLRGELIKHLRKEKKKRGRPRSSESKRGKIPGAVSIDERPAEVLGRQIPGHWEGDLVMGKAHQSAIGTLAERTTRTLILVPLKAQDAASVRKAFEKEFQRIPARMKRTLTYDNGKEMSEHRHFTRNTKIKVYFTHPFSPWERPTNENSNGLVRDYFPKGTDFRLVSPQRLKEVQDQLNNRPRKVLNWKTPKEVFDSCIMQQMK
jgi:IS30 family transposase